MRSSLTQTLVLAVQALLIAGAVTGAVILVTRLVGGPSLSISQITTNKQSTFDVSGESKITTIPDQAEVSMGISINENTVKAAQDNANTVINTINTRLGELGIEKKDIKTENYSLYPNMDYTPGSGQRITGYSVNANLVVTITDFAKMNQAIDLATQAGANQIGGITFTLSDAKHAEAEEQAREEAITDAREKASKLSNLAGMKLGKIVNIMETPDASGDFRPEAALMDRAAGGGAGAPTNIEPGSTSFNYQVILSYETL